MNLFAGAMLVLMFWDATTESPTYEDDSKEPWFRNPNTWRMTTFTTLVVALALRIY